MLVRSVARRKLEQPEDAAGARDPASQCRSGHVPKGHRNQKPRQIMAPTPFVVDAVARVPLDKRAESAFFHLVDHRNLNGAFI